MKELWQGGRGEQWKEGQKEKEQQIKEARTQMWRFYATEAVVGIYFSFMDAPAVSWHHLQQVDNGHISAMGREPWTEIKHSVAATLQSDTHGQASGISAPKSIVRKMLRI